MPINEDGHTFTMEGSPHGYHGFGTFRPVPIGAADLHQRSRTDRPINLAPIGANAPIEIADVTPG